MSYTIEDFWLPRFRSVVRQQTSLKLTGWSTPETSESFVEADLRLRPDYGDVTSPIWFVAAPGAVGKSTLAREISARTGAVYLDLARAETVAGNYLTGGLVKNDLLDAWQTEKATVLIDALDEARLRVTQKSFEDFLADVEALSRNRNLPTVLFGRVGIVEEAILILLDLDLYCPVFDIDFFDAPRARKFVMAALQRLAKDARYGMPTGTLAGHRSAYEKAIDDFVRGLEHASASDGARFAGYAPVLEAVATVLAGVSNPMTLDTVVLDTMQQQVLQKITDQISQREATKLQDQLAEVVPAEHRGNLYLPEEQLSRLAGRVFAVSAPISAPALPSHYVAAYDQAVKILLMQHPFLDGAGQSPSGAVFAAAINAYGLFSTSAEMVAAAGRHAGDGPHTPNPFLIDFYLDRAAKTWGENPVIPPEHVVALYESVRARAPVGDVVRLTVEGDEASDEADVEIFVSPAGAQGLDRRIQLRTSQAGALRFGRQVSGVAVDAPLMDVVIGSGKPVEIVAPVSLNVARLTFEAPELVVLRGEHATQNPDAAVVLEAGELVASSVTSAPIVRKGAEFSVSWPGASAYPWTAFESTGDGGSAAVADDALRALRRLVMAFRSHGKGRLARFKDKIEHARMTKGALGDAIRQRMMQDGILTLEGQMYFLDSNALGQMTGATYQDLKLKRFNDKVRQYLALVNV